MPTESRASQGVPGRPGPGVQARARSLGGVRGRGRGLGLGADLLLVGILFYPEWSGANAVVGKGDDMTRSREENPVLCCGLYRVPGSAAVRPEHTLPSESACGRHGQHVPAQHRAAAEAGVPAGPDVLTPSGRGTPKAGVCH